MTVKLSGPMLAPQSGAAPKQAVVLLHGYGSDGEDLISLGAHWQELLPDALFVSPNAPTVSAANPMGFQWFDIDGNRPEFRVEGARLGGVAIRDFLNELWAQTGLEEKDTILVGFSQGAMMALNVGLSLDRPLMGIIAFAGALLPPDGFGERAFAKPPICIIHGDRDEVVPTEMGASAAETLRANGYEVSYHVSPGVGHGISPDGLGFASHFIAALSVTL
jgi:phospholipase/carboxylesterase